MTPQEGDEIIPGMQDLIDNDDPIASWLAFGDRL